MDSNVVDYNKLLRKKYTKATHVKKIVPIRDPKSGKFKKITKNQGQPGKPAVPEENERESSPGPSLTRTRSVTNLNLRRRQKTEEDSFKAADRDASKKLKLDSDIQCEENSSINKDREKDISPVPSTSRSVRKTTRSQDVPTTSKVHSCILYYLKIYFYFLSLK